MIDYSEINACMAERAVELGRMQHKALVVPLGGANAEGTVGYVAALKRSWISSVGLQRR
jgi:hypothetical protein